MFPIFKTVERGSIMNTMVWLAAMVALIVIEIVTVNIGAIWFALGALAAVLVSLLGAGTILQTAVFLAVSFVTLIFTRPLVVKYINGTRIRTNYEGIIGKAVRITQDVDNIAETGCAVVNGQEWTARSADNGRRIEAGSLAKVVDIKGVKLIVEKYD